jgi:hypothetical protein
MLFPLIKEDADRLERFMGANLMSSEAEKKEKLTALVVEWKPTGFSTASTTTMVQPVCECLKKLSAIVNTVLKENEQLKKTLTAEQIVLMQLGKPDFQRQATLKMQGMPTLPLLHT